MTYREKIEQYLILMFPGEKREINSICRSGNKDLFIAEVKHYMDTHDWQGYIEFTDNYTKIRKLWI
jgi:hypothetical protein